MLDHDDADLGQVHLLHLLDEGSAHLCRAGGDGHAGGLQGGDLGAGCALVGEGWRRRGSRAWWTGGYKGARRVRGARGR